MTVEHASAYSQSSTVVFDLETIPDVNGLRALHSEYEGLPDEEVVQHAYNARREKTGSDFLPHHLHRIVAISCVFRGRKGFHVKSLGNLNDDESTLIQSFYQLIEDHAPQLVSWNGGGFDLPVLHYRSLIHGVNAQRYWDMGERDRDSKWNNYIGRYHTRHIDMMDLLALYQPRANAPLDALAKLCGFPGKLGMDGSQVWEAYQAGQLEDIRHYCETDVVNTYLLYCRFQKTRGYFSHEQYVSEIDLVKSTLNTLTSSSDSRWQEYLDTWAK